MSYVLDEGGLLHTDACCWIDLFATGKIEEIIRAVPFRFAVSEYIVREEVLSVLSGAGVEERCDFQELIGKGLVSVFGIKAVDEMEHLIRFAAHLDDGEASVCALASVHGGGVASTDRKVLSTLKRLEIAIPVIQTPELLFQWAERTCASQEQVRMILQSVTARARFSPRRDVPYADWWYETLRGK